ncbi:MAG: WD40 repeat domain-containing protein [Gemmataceae bacterium]
MTTTILPAGALPDPRVFGEPRLHSDGELLALAFGPDNSLWSVEEPGVLRHWNAAGGQQLSWISLSDLETLWAFSKDNRILASGSDDLTLWDVASGRVLASLPQESWVSAIAFAAHPTFIATGHDDGVVRCWDSAGRHLVHELRLHNKPISALAFNSDSKVLAVASEDKTISLWDVAAGKHLGTLGGHTDRIPALAWQPGSTVLVSAGWDTCARVWDTTKLAPIILLNAHAAQVTALAFNPQGNLLASADSAFAVHIWDFPAKKQLRRLTGPQAEARCLAFSRDGRMLAANGDRLIHLWDPATGAPTGGAGPRPTAPTHLAVDKTGRHLAGNGGGGQPRLWNVTAPEQPLTLAEKETVHGLRFSPDGKLLAGAAGSHIRIWDAASGQPKLDLEGPDVPITAVAYAPDGKTIAGAGATGTSVWLWNAASGEPVLLIPDALEGCTIEALAFHPGGRLLAVGGIDWLATGGSNGAVSVWDIEARAEIDTFSAGATCLAYHPGGKRIAFATLEHSIAVWEPAANSSDEDALSAEIYGHEDAIHALAYSPDGRYLASAGADHTIRLWNEDGDEVAAFEVDSAVTDLAFASDGQTLFSANANTTCYQFSLADVLRTV